MRIWSGGKDIQSIPQPGSIWNLSINDAGDIVTASSDSAVRVFSRDPNKTASADDIKSFQKDCMKSSAEKAGMSEDQIVKLPGVDKMGIICNVMKLSIRERRKEISRCFGMAQHLLHTPGKLTTGSSSGRSSQIASPKLVGRLAKNATTLAMRSSHQEITTISSTSTMNLEPLKSSPSTTETMPWLRPRSTAREKDSLRAILSKSGNSYQRTQAMYQHQQARWKLRRQADWS